MSSFLRLESANKLKLILSTAETTEGEAVNGSLVAVEVAHDMDEDEYVFTSSLDSAPSKEGQAFQSVAKKALADKLRPIFQRFPKAMLETHGKDLLADDGSSTPASGSSTPAAPAAAPKSTPTVPSSATVASATASMSKASFNTAVVKANGEFASDAEGLFEFLTSAEKIPLWSRNPAKMAPEVGAEMSLFGGNIAGKVTEVNRPTSFTTTWRAPTWPEGHFGTLETTLNQGSSSTTLELRLSGVPVGKEDEAERNVSSTVFCDSIVTNYPSFSAQHFLHQRTEADRVGPSLHRDTSLNSRRSRSPSSSQSAATKSLALVGQCGSGRVVFRRCWGPGSSLLLRTERSGRQGVDVAVEGDRPSRLVPCVKDSWTEVDPPFFALRRLGTLL